MKLGTIVGSEGFDIKALVVAIGSGLYTLALLLF